MAERPRARRSAKLALARELVRAAGGLALAPLHASFYLARKRALREACVRDLASAPRTWEPGPPPHLPARPLRIFLSCAEASGEQHALNLLAALRARIAAAGASAPVVHGLGGSGLRAAGVHLLGAPAERAAMGFEGIAAALPYYLGLVEACAAHFAEERPDLFVPVDSPALHVPLAHLARGRRIPTVHFITPQYWGWAPWRVRGYARAVDLALTILPFEPAWFERHGVRVAHVGHPLLDSPAPSAPGARAESLVLLPGSRAGVIAQNLGWMLALALGEHRALGRPPLVVALRDEAGAALATAIARGAPESAAALEAGTLRIAAGELDASLAGARAALSVSGTVVLELLRRRLPAVVIYRVPDRRTQWAARHLLTTPWFTSVNLLAARELYPEFCFAGEGPRAAAGAALRRAFLDEGWRADCAAGLGEAARRLGVPGACERAAAAILELAARQPARREGA